MKRRYPRDRGGDLSSQAPRGSSRAGEPRRFETHRLYGEIPLVCKSAVGRDGKLYEWWIHDADYEPPLPRGAVRANVRRQVYCTAHDVPKYFYVDERRECVQCGRSFTFGALEQKFWYEALAFNFNSVPIRCLVCRRQRRSEHALREQIGIALRAVRANPADPGAHLSLARAIVELHERSGHGDLSKAVSAARASLRLWPDSSEALFWEGAAHALAGRAAKARACLDDFLARPGQARGRLAGRARDILAKL